MEAHRTFIVWPKALIRGIMLCLCFLGQIDIDSILLGFLLLRIFRRQLRLSALSLGGTYSWWFLLCITLLMDEVCWVVAILDLFSITISLWQSLANKKMNSPMTVLLTDMTFVWMDRDFMIFISSLVSFYITTYLANICIIVNQTVSF